MIINNKRLTLSPGLPGQPPQRQAGVVPRRGRGEEGEQLQQQRGERGPDMAMLAGDTFAESLH